MDQRTDNRSGAWLGTRSQERIAVSKTWRVWMEEERSLRSSHAQLGPARSLFIAAIDDHALDPDGPVELVELSWSLPWRLTMQQAISGTVDKTVRCNRRSPVVSPVEPGPQGGYVGEAALHGGSLPDLGD